ncbi:hypothetical protein Ddye_024558 [Dipteronia dyeriana]|uniref:Uncharacterized protein n=1 Tax=Dipteronia dyeriana TaxID=168575 RepID=A0AAD9WUK1_9ROSI|nr:hypothetical protein Ddye_024558 [Dipteronia dyeriana]
MLDNSETESSTLPTFIDFESFDSRNAVTTRQKKKKKKKKLQRSIISLHNGKNEDEEMDVVQEMEVVVGVCFQIEEAQFPPLFH